MKALNRKEKLKFVDRVELCSCINITLAKILYPISIFWQGNNQHPNLKIFSFSLVCVRDFSTKLYTTMLCWLTSFQNIKIGNEILRHWNLDVTVLRNYPNTILKSLQFVNEYRQLTTLTYCMPCAAYKPNITALCCQKGANTRILTVTEWELWAKHVIDLGFEVMQFSKEILFNPQVFRNSRIRCL